MTSLAFLSFCIVLCTSAIASTLCIFYDKIRARYGLSTHAMTVLIMSFVIAGGITCFISNEVL